MKQPQSIAQAHHPAIEKARAKNPVLEHVMVEGIRNSMRRAGGLMWPLVAAAMSDQRLPIRINLDTPTKRVLFKLSHSDFDWDAFEEAVKRQRAGGAMTAAERKSHIERTQLQADVLSGLTGDDSAILPTGVLPQIRELNRGLSGSRQRFLLWADFQSTYFDVLNERAGNNLISAYNRWSSDKVFYVCKAMDKLIAYLGALPVIQCNLLRSRYMADCLLINRSAWMGRKPEVTLAAAIISARIVSPSHAIFDANPKLANKLIRAFDIYFLSCKAIDRQHPKAFNANHLKVREFRLRYPG